MITLGSNMTGGGDEHSALLFHYKLLGPKNFKAFFRTTLNFLSFEKSKTSHSKLFIILASEELSCLGVYRLASVTSSLLLSLVTSQRENWSRETIRRSLGRFWIRKRLVLESYEGSGVVISHSLSWSDCTKHWISVLKKKKWKSESQKLPFLSAKAYLHIKIALG